MVANDLNYQRDLVKMGKRITPYSEIYPHVNWVNLSDGSKEVGTFGLLSPSRTLHPLTSIFGMTYFNITAVVLAQTLLNPEDRIAAISRDTPTNFSDLEKLPVSERHSGVPLVHLLIFERYVRDISYRRAVRKAVSDNVNFDLYRRMDDKAVSSYFTCWFPELINNLVHMDLTGQVHDFLTNEKDGNRWYLPFLMCSEEEFLAGYKELMDEFDSIYHTRVHGKYWTLVD